MGDTAAGGPATAACRLGETDNRIRGLRRIGRRGLAGACLDGMLASGAHYLAVMEPHHDAALLAAMLDRLRGGGGVVVANRRPADPRTGAARALWPAKIVQKMLGADLHDPMSRFFMIQRNAFEDLVPALSSESITFCLTCCWRPAGACVSRNYPAQHPAAASPERSIQRWRSNSPGWWPRA